MKVHVSTKALVSIIGFLLPLHFLHGSELDDYIDSDAAEIAFIVDKREFHYSELLGEEYGYIDIEPHAPKDYESEYHQDAEDAGNKDSQVVINVEDADKVRRPHMYPDDPVTSNYMKKQQFSMQVVFIIGAILVSIVAVTGVVCYCRRVRGSSISL